MRIPPSIAMSSMQRWTPGVRQSPLRMTKQPTEAHIRQCTVGFRRVKKVQIMLSRVVRIIALQNLLQIASHPVRIMITFPTKKGWAWYSAYINMKRTDRKSLNRLSSRKPNRRWVRPRFSPSSYPSSWTASLLIRALSMPANSRSVLVISNLMIKTSITTPKRIRVTSSTCEQSTWAALPWDNPRIPWRIATCHL